ncbi:MAG: pitrilysin family protein [Planctomycetota bacterium]
MKALLQAILVEMVIAVPAIFAQETPHGTSVDLGRGDAHSPGWKKVEELKGEPLSPRFPKLGEKIKRQVFANGLVLYLREDDRLPLMRAELVVKTGSYYEAPEQPELASFTSAQMREGGTEKLGAQELTDRLAYLAANLSSSSGDETSSVSLDVLAVHADEGLALFADVIRRPAFDPERFEIAKTRSLFQLRHRNDSPGPILQRELNKLLYTEAHPRGRETRPEHIEKLERDDLVAFHRRHFTPDRAYLAVVGAFDSNQMAAKIKGLFGDWKPSGEPLAALPTVTPTPRPGIYVVDRKLNQSNIAIAHWGTNRADPDRFAINLMNSVLGGGSFSSRITERVRSDEGLAYSAGSQYATGDREVGLFRASVQTKTESTVRAVRCICEEIEKMRTGTISENEFKTAKEALLYSYVFRFDDPAENVMQLMRLEIEGLAADYYEQEFAGYRAVSKADMARVARQALRPGELTIFVVGELDTFRDELGSIGEIHEVELTEFGGPGRMRR